MKDQSNKIPIPIYTIIATLVSILITVLCLWIASSISTNHQTVSTVLNGIAGIVLASGLFSWWGTFVANRGILTLIEKNFGLSQELQESGILKVEYWPLSIPESILEIDAVVIRGHSFFKIWAARIAGIANQPNGNIRLCLLHPKNKSIPILASTFGEDKDEMRKKICDSLIELISQANKVFEDDAKGRIVLYVHQLSPTHTYYRFADSYYFSWYTLRRGRTEKLPLLKLSQGTLSDFFKDDFEKLLQERDTEVAYDSEADQEVNRKSLLSIGLEEADVDKLFPVISTN